jgi:hypothetical protein
MSAKKSESGMISRKSAILGASIVALSSVALSACKPLLQANRTAYIVGSSNDIVKLVPADVDEPAKNAANAAVLIVTLLESKKKKFCSGTLVQNGPKPNDVIVLTNHHCFAEVDDEGNVAKEVVSEACTNTKVYLGFRSGESDRATEMTCLPGSLQTDFNGDLGVFKLGGPIPSPYAPLMLWSAGEIPAEREAMIIHYPDIEDNFAQVSNSKGKLPLASITQKDCLTKGNFAKAEWKFDHTLPFSMKHTCDLLHGSSGSALIDKQSLTILGVNWGGIKIDYKNEKTTINVATRVDYVQAFLNGTLEEYKKSVTSSAATASSSAGGAGSSSSKEKSKADSTTRTVTCGVLSTENASSSRQQAMIWLILLSPALILSVSSRKKRQKS